MTAVHSAEMQSLKESVQRYRVCWEVWPEYALVGTERRKIGFELELSGSHPAEITQPSPGCRHCREIFAALVDIAEWIIPKERRPSKYEVSTYEKIIRYSSNRHFRPEVSLSVRILHRMEQLAPVDDCGLCCLAEMEAKLGGLGASSGSWTRRRKEAS